MINLQKKSKNIYPKNSPKKSKICNKISKNISQKNSKIYIQKNQKFISKKKSKISTQKFIPKKS